MPHIDPDAATRLVAALSVPPGPIHTEPTALSVGANDPDALYDALLAECAAACIELGQFDLRQLAWLARCGPGVALTVASLIQRAAYWPDGGGSVEPGLRAI